MTAPTAPVCARGGRASRDVARHGGCAVICGSEVRRGEGQIRNVRNLEWRNSARRKFDNYSLIPLSNLYKIPRLWHKKRPETVNNGRYFLQAFWFVAVVSWRLLNDGLDGCSYFLEGSGCLLSGTMEMRMSRALKVTLEQWLRTFFQLPRHHWAHFCGAKFCLSTFRLFPIPPSLGSCEGGWLLACPHAILCPL